MRNWIKKIVEAAKTARYYKESEARRREFLKAWSESWRGAGVAAPPREVSDEEAFWLTRDGFDYPAWDAFRVSAHVQSFATKTAVFELRLSANIVGRPHERWFMAALFEALKRTVRDFALAAEKGAEATKTEAQGVGHDAGERGGDGHGGDAADPLPEPVAALGSAAVFGVEGHAALCGDAQPVDGHEVEAAAACRDLEEAALEKPRDIGAELVADYAGAAGVGFAGVSGEVKEDFAGQTVHGKPL